MSSTTPAGRHLPNHVFIEVAESWASVRQIKSVDQSRLGAKMVDTGEPTLERAAEVLVARLASKRNNPRTTHTGMEPGTIWEMPLRAQRGPIKPTRMLVLDYNHGNHMAIAVEVEQRHSAESPVRIPIGVDGRSQPASALVHRVKSIDMDARTVTKVGVVQGRSLENVGRTLLSMIDR